MSGPFYAVADHFALSGQEFADRLRAVTSDQWSWPTPCTEWTVRDLVRGSNRF